MIMLLLGFSSMLDVDGLSLNSLVVMCQLVCAHHMSEGTMEDKIESILAMLDRQERFFPY
jgi:hypothetical protein